MPRWPPCDPRSAPTTSTRQRRSPRPGGPIRAPIHEAKDTAQAAFRAAVGASTDSDALETAARDWLNEINRINIEARDASATGGRRARRGGGHRRDPRAPQPRGRLGPDRRRERRRRVPGGPVGGRRVRRASRHGRAEPPWPRRPRQPPVPGAAVHAARRGRDRSGWRSRPATAPCIFRLLRGDRHAMTTLVASLAGDDPDGRRHWQLLMTSLVEAIIADAIEAAALEFPLDHPFWGPFTQGPGARRQPGPVVARLSLRWPRWLDRRALPVAARPVAGPRLRGSRPDADPR